MANQALKNSLRYQLANLNHQQQAMQAEADKLGVPLTEMRLADGSWALVPILLARGQALLALSYLEAGKP